MKIEQSAVSTLLYVIACGLHGETPAEEKLQGTDIKYLYYAANAHSLSALTCMALLKTEYFKNADPEITGKWKEAKDKAIRKNLMLDAERRQIFAEMDRQQIWYMPLKGSVLKFLYPAEGMRQMADNDILFDATYQNEVKAIFKARKYKVISFAQGNHDVYRKDPIYNFEMHTELFSDSAYPEIYPYFADMCGKLIPDAEGSYGRHLSHEDFYVYVTAHAYKHHSRAGTGLRTLTDFYIFNKAYGATLNREYVAGQLRQMKMEEYEAQCRSLAEHLFGRAEVVDIQELPAEEQRILQYSASSGTYGTMEVGIKRGLQKQYAPGTQFGTGKKIKYYLNRLFPGREWFKRPYPTLYRYPVLIPFFWVYRIIRMLVFDRVRIKREVGIVKSISEVEEK